MCPKKYQNKMINRVVDQQWSSLIHYLSFAGMLSHMEIWQHNSYVKTHRNKSSLILYPEHKHIHRMLYYVDVKSVPII